MISALRGKGFGLGFGFGFGYARLSKTANANNKSCDIAITSNNNTVKQRTILINKMIPTYPLPVPAVNDAGSRVGTVLSSVGTDIGTKCPLITPVNPLTSR